MTDEPTIRDKGSSSVFQSQERLTALIAQAQGLLNGLSNDGHWRSWKDGNQAVNIQNQSPFKGEHCGASIVEGLPRAWNPHFVGINVFSLPKEFNVSRFRDEDADFIAAAPQLVRDLLEALLASGGPRPKTPEPHEHQFSASPHELCVTCFRTEADIAGDCHHCSDQQSVEAGRCWWCLRIVGGPRRDPDAGATRTLCHVCGKPATCIGAYEGETVERPACDSCCGHGNEDGWCRPIETTSLIDAPRATPQAGEEPKTTDERDPRVDSLK